MTCRCEIQIVWKMRLSSRMNERHHSQSVLLTMLIFLMQINLNILMRINKMWNLLRSITSFLQLCSKHLSEFWLCISASSYPPSVSSLRHCSPLLYALLLNLTLLQLLPLHFHMRPGLSGTVLLLKSKASDRDLPALSWLGLRRLGPL